MHSLPSIFEAGNYSESYNFLQEVLGSAEVFNIESSNVSTISMAEAKAAAANKSHSEAERRRRKRINGHLATLRNLLPNTIKTDKASLLAEVVRCLRDLKKTTAELAAPDGDDNGNQNIMSNTTMKYIFPSENDELKLSYSQEDSGIIRATLCCDDRPEMITELTRALNSVQAKAVRAEIATVGGRTKTVLWVQISGGGEEGMATLRKALKLVIDKSVLLPTQGQSLPGSKRPRLYQC